MPLEYFSVEASWYLILGCWPVIPDLKQHPNLLGRGRNTPYVNVPCGYYWLVLFMACAFIHLCAVAFGATSVLNLSASRERQNKLGQVQWGAVVSWNSESFRLLQL